MGDVKSFLSGNNNKLSEVSTADSSSDIIYGLHDKPPVLESIFAALQHLLAMFVGIITPPAIVCGVLGFPIEMSAFVINMALFASGICTFIQVRKFGPIGSGILSIQGTSFTFLGAMIATGFAVKGAGGSNEDALVTMFGISFAGSFIQMVASRFLPYLKKIITPLVSGIVVSLIGLSLIKVGITDFGGGFGALKNGSFGSFQNLGLASLVLLTIIVLNRSRNRFIRMSAIVIGLVIGYSVAAFMGLIDFSQLSKIDIFAFPVPFKYGFFKFSWTAFIPISILFLLATVESIGDLTATSMISKLPIEGEQYINTISGGVLGDGFNSAVAAVFNSFPNSTFSQNNGVIQLTGVASRHIGMYIAGFLALFGVFPIIGGLFTLMPSPVLGGATIIMFGTVAAAGIKIIASSIIDRRGMMIMAISFGAGLGVLFMPDILKNMPQLVKDVFGSSVTTGGVAALLCNIVLPHGGLSEEKIGEKLDVA